MIHRLRPSSAILETGLARLSIAIGAAASLALMLRAGRRNPSTLLLTLMAIWVLSPFLALFAAGALAKRWSDATRAALFAITLLVTAGTLAVYGYDALHPRPKAALVFVVAPPVCWVVSALALAIVARRAKPAAGDRDP